jgi:hypothetical protein
MRIQILLLFGITLASNVAGSTDTQSELQLVGNPLDYLEPNSCAIRCPAHSAFPDKGAGVTCGSTAIPICQCTDVDEPIAYCEVVT